MWCKLLIKKSILLLIDVIKSFVNFTSAVMKPEAELSKSYNSMVESG